MFQVCTKGSRATWYPGQIKNTLAPEMQAMKKIFTLAAANYYFLIDLTDFFKKVYTYRTILTPLFFVEKQTVLPFIVQKEKSINFVE